MDSNYLAFNHAKCGPVEFFWAFQFIIKAGKKNKERETVERTIIILPLIMLSVVEWNFFGLSTSL